MLLPPDFSSGLTANKPSRLPVSFPQSAEVTEDLPPQVELLASFNGLINSIEQLQSGFLLNPDSFSDELATPPRKVLHTLR